MRLAPVHTEPEPPELAPPSLNPRGPLETHPSLNIDCWFLIRVLGLLKGQENKDLQAWVSQGSWRPKFRVYHCLVP